MKQQRPVVLFRLHYPSENFRANSQGISASGCLEQELSSSGRTCDIIVL
jgi:hypothetical protein